MTPEELYQELVEIHRMDKKGGETLIRRIETYLAEKNFQWNRIKMIESNLALKFLYMRCLSLELRLSQIDSQTNRQFSNPDPCGE